MNNGSLSPSGGYTYIYQEIPSLCKYVYYTLSFDSKAVVIGANPYSYMGATLNISLNGGQQLVGNAPNDFLPSEYERRSYTFPYTRNTGAQALTIRFACTAPSCEYIIDNISLVGHGENIS